MLGFFKNLLLFFAALILALVIAEISVRQVYPLQVYDYQDTSSKFLFFDCDNELAWVGKKNISGTFQRKYFSARVSHDSFGQRNNTAPIVDGKENIWLLGDSFVWGWGVDDANTLQSQLNRIQPTKNVYALAAPGYGTVHQQLLLRRFLTAGLGKPDRVIMLLINNDFTDNTVGIYENTRRAKNPLSMPKYVMQDNRLQLVPKTKDCKAFEKGIDKKKVRLHSKRLLEESHFYNLLSAVFYNTTMSSAGISADRDPTDENVQIMAMALQKIHSELKLNNIALKVFYLDFGHDNGLPLLQEALNNNLELIKVDGAKFYQSPGNVIPFDGHLTAKGHQKLAKIIAANL